jgi:hypothetical protein
MTVLAIRKDEPVEVEFLGYKCNVIKDAYKQGGVALILEEVGTGDHIATASVWVPGVNPGEVAIKNYSENEGMLGVLIKAKVVSAPLRFVQSGFVEIPVCKFMWSE